MDQDSKIEDGLLYLYYGGKPIHLVMCYDDNAWFNAEDVCNLLLFPNYKTDLRVHVTSENKQKLEDLVDNYKSYIKTKKGDEYYINCDGFCQLLAKSKYKSDVENIKRWIVDDVTPLIKSRMIDYFKMIICDMDDENKKLREEIKKLKI
jgi:prophage antirepressor-like protein